MLQTTFPSSDPGRKRDMKATVDFLTSIYFFRLKVQDISAPPRASEVVRDSLIRGLDTAYKWLFNNCNNVYYNEFEVRITSHRSI